MKHKFFYIILKLKVTMWIWWTKINQNPAFQGVYLWLREEIEYDEKVTLTPE